MTNSATQSGALIVREHDRRRWILLLILAVPSIYVLLTLPPLWRDSDGFNEVASTFAPKGIIHWLPGYCLGARLILLGAGIVGSLLGGHGIPYLSISITPLNNVGLYTLILVQHLFLVFSLFYAVKAFSSLFFLQVAFCVFLALTPWLYIYANCVGSEAFSNPLVYLICAYGWKCLKANEPGRQRLLVYFALLVGASLTRQINTLFASLLPLALLPLATGELVRRRSTPTWLPSANPIRQGSQIFDFRDHRPVCNRNLGPGATGLVPAVPGPFPLHFWGNI